MKQGKDFIGVIVSNPIKKEYTTQYQLQVKKIDKKPCNIRVYIRIKGENDLQYGDEISFLGEYLKPDTARNDKGFDNKQYLKSIGIVGSVTAKKVQVIQKEKGNPFEKLACKTRQKMEEQIRKKLPDKNCQDLLLGILLGNDDEMENEIKENFRGSSLSHILAVSGMHVAYLVTIVNWSRRKNGNRETKNKRNSNFVT